VVDLASHPTVVSHRAETKASPPHTLDADLLRSLCLEAGADDVGFVEVDREDLAVHRADIIGVFPRTKSIISIVCRMNRENIRTPMRSIANVEFHHVVHKTDDVVREIVSKLEALGVRAINAAAVGFPMEMDRFGAGKQWLVSHKPIAEAAGLGRMGIHRNVIHPRFGNFVLLGTVLLDAEVSAYSRPLDFSPCLECKLCVSACPTGAIAPDGHFDFAACYTHNYREFSGGFIDWVNGIADSSDSRAYRDRFTPAETASMWQSLSFGANYKAAYCMAVCPAGEDVIGPYLADRKQYMEEIAKPLTEKVETVYVVAGSDPEAYVPRRFPHKPIKRVRNGLSNIRSIFVFLRSLTLVFQRGRSAGLNATFHFSFVGREPAEVTVEIRNKTIKVTNGRQGAADFAMTVDSDAWLRFVRKEVKLPWLLLGRKLRFRGSPRLLQAFGRCFPS
jgi:Fe-S-cluster-containing hydrogenase component 2